MSVSVRGLKHPWDAVAARLCLAAPLTPARPSPAARCLAAAAVPSAPSAGLSAGVFFIKALNHIQDVSVCSSNEITQTTHPQFGFRRASAARPKS